MQPGGEATIQSQFGVSYQSSFHVFGLWEEEPAALGEDQQRRRIHFVNLIGKKLQFMFTQSVISITVNKSTDKKPGRPGLFLVS